MAYIGPNTHAQLESFYAVPQMGGVLVPLNYRLTPEQFQHALSQMKAYRTSAKEYLAYGALKTAIALGLTAPVGWMSRHQALVRTVLGLK